MIKLIQKLLQIYSFFMEHISRQISKNLKLEQLLTQIPKDDAKVRFQSNNTFTPAHTSKKVQNVPLRSFIMAHSKTQIRNVDAKRMKVDGVNNLKSILKLSKEMASSKKQVNKENREHVNAQTQRSNKYFRISINDDELKQTTENSERIYDIPTSKIEALKPSINKLLQKTQTQAFQEKQYKRNLKESTKNVKRMQRRRKCIMTTQQLFEDQCTKYLDSKQKQQTEELFREMNRLMKLHQKRKNPNNYYQMIRKSAQKKIDYMSQNQKYYDDAEVRHLFSVVENCNILIHKRGSHQRQKEIFSKRIKTDKIGKYNNHNKVLNLTEKREIDEDKPLNRTSISAKDIAQLQKFNFKESRVVNKLGTPETVKRTQRQKVSMNKKFSNIVQVCEKQRKMLEQVKNGMKVFEFYCDKIDTGFAYKGKRLNNFLTGYDQG